MVVCTCTCNGYWVHVVCTLRAERGDECGGGRGGEGGGRLGGERSGELCGKCGGVLRTAVAVRAVESE